MEGNLLQKRVNPKLPSNSLYSFNTLELLDHTQCLQGLQGYEPPLKSLLKKAQNNYFSKELSRNLTYLDSPLNKAYRRTLFECCTHIQQEGKKLTSKYCGYRWCNVCNRIRTAKLYNGYLKPLQELEQCYLVTSTIPNVKGGDLRESIREMISTSTKIIRGLKRKNIKFNGLRKLECTYNFDNDNYHPHFHFSIEGRDTALAFQREWLNRYPSANLLGQDIRIINDYSEVFKYVTKIVSKSKKGDYNIYVAALDTIFRSMKNIRTFQTFGTIKKINEEIEDLQSEQFEDIEPYDFVIWKWEQSDWVNMINGKGLTNYEPDKEMIELTTEKMIV